MHEAVSVSFLKMENIADEFRNILEDTYDYKGMPCSKLIPQSSVEALIDWETREDDIFIATYPKSGNHFFSSFFKDGFNTSYNKTITHMRSQILK